MIYTISPDLLRNIEPGNGIYFSDILFVFSIRGNPYKITKDKHGEILNCYKTIKENSEIIKCWLDLMSYLPSPFETIDVDIRGIECEETKFLKICKETNGEKKLVLYSLQNVKKYPITQNRLVFEEVAIDLLDRDAILIELKPKDKNGDTYVNSQVAKNGSNITDSKNK